MMYRVYIGQYQKQGNCVAPTLYAKTNDIYLVENINQALTKVHEGIDLYISKGYGKQVAFYRENMQYIVNDNDLLRFIDDNT